ncbi:Scarecrow-like protein 18 [Linum perenne]
MLSSFNNSSDEDSTEQPSPSASASAALDLHFHLAAATHPQPPPPFPPPLSGPSSSSSSSSSPSIQVRQLIVRCSELISQADYSAAHRLITILSAASSPYGDSSQRLSHHFASALSLHLTRAINPGRGGGSASAAIDAAVQSCYLTLNQITPFIRFTHLTANQAILESVLLGQNEPEDQGIHIVDFDIMHGVQWPPLMQALAERHPPPSLRITGTGQDPETLTRTGDRLSKFAQSLGLTFQFHPLLLISSSAVEHHHHLIPSAVTILPGETLAVNCMFYLHRLINEHDYNVMVRTFLRRIKEMSPRVVTIGEREMDGGAGGVGEAVEYYQRVFESLEETVAPTSSERASVERVWFGKEIKEVVAGGRKDQKLRRWSELMRSVGFRNVGLSPFAVSQAKLLLRLHYPSEGYRLHLINDDDDDGGGGDGGSSVSGLFLGWRDRPLFSLSSWH